jgi:hypothetical protein
MPHQVTVVYICRTKSIMMGLAALYAAPGHLHIHVRHRPHARVHRVSLGDSAEVIVCQTRRSHAAPGPLRGRGYGRMSSCAIMLAAPSALSLHTALRHPAVSDFGDECLVVIQHHNNDRLCHSPLAFFSFSAFSFSSFFSCVLEPSTPPGH